MKTLDAIYRAYQKHGTHELETKLCRRAKKLAAIVLKQFRLHPYHQNYEDYMQTAFLVLWEILPEYDPKVGRLEGFFMVSFKHRMINIIKSEIEEKKLRSDVDVDTLSNSETIFDLYYIKELQETINKLLSEGERRLFDFFHTNGHNIKEINRSDNVLERRRLFQEIADELEVTTQDVQIGFASMYEKLEAILKNKCAVCDSEYVSSYVLKGVSLRPMCYACYKENK